MKRAISILVACILAMSSAPTGFAVYAEEEKEANQEDDVYGYCYRPRIQLSKYGS